MNSTGEIPEKSPDCLESAFFGGSALVAYLASDCDPGHFPAAGPTHEEGVAVRSRMRLQRRTHRGALAAAVCGLVACLTTTAGATPAAADPRCTVTGTARSDVLRGTNGADVICGLGGNDTITGLAGDDVILGGAGNDRVDGGPGNDTLRGDAGDDTLAGGDGNDTISGGDGADKAYGGAGADSADGGLGADSLAGDAGNDVLSGDAGNDSVNGGDGNDTISGGDGADKVYGGAGDDNVTGGSGNDTVSGDAGRDTVNAGAGNDSVNGGTDADVLRGGDGNDNVNGDAGDDALAGDAGTDRLAGGLGVNTCAPGDVSRDCSMDATGPTISDLQLPAEVEPGQTITFTWRAQDASGVSSTDVRVGGYQGWASWCFAVPAVLLSGDMRDGRWSATCQVPAATINDTLQVEVFSVDILGTGLAAPVKGSFEVVGASSDRDAPAISEVVVPETAQRGQTAVFSVRLQDATGVGFASVILRSPNGVGFIWGSSFTLVSGDGRDGIYRIDAVVPADAAVGDYDLWVWVGDTLNNRTVEMNVGTVAVRG